VVGGEERDYLRMRSFANFCDQVCQRPANRAGRVSLGRLRKHTRFVEFIKRDHDRLSQHERSSHEHVLRPDYGHHSVNRFRKHRFARCGQP
jgi:hypothetical protein